MFVTEAAVDPGWVVSVQLGSLARIDIGALLMAGVVPGPLLAAMYVVLVILPMRLVVFSVIGSMLLGWATPTEPAGFRALSVVVLAPAFRCLSWDAILTSLNGTLAVSIFPRR